MQTGLDTTNSPLREHSLQATVEDADSDNEFADPEPSQHPRASTLPNSPPRRWSPMPSPGPGFHPHSPPPHSSDSLPDEPDTNQGVLSPDSSGRDLPPSLDADADVLLNEIYDNVKLADLRASLAFILGLQTASLDDPNTGLSKEAIDRLRHPLQDTLNLDRDPILRLAIRLYLELKNADEDYLKVRAALQQFNPVLELPGISRIKTIAAELSGIEEMTVDICPCKCIAFTGPFARSTECPECEEARYDENNKPCQKFTSFPIGPQLCITSAVQP
ncbi:hypothetical protein JVU11DRAFT_12709 [Chiua virens]|nr:hypothetical protein JVU11DRAFT_12709 [Chiua virens]